MLSSNIRDLRNQLAEFAPAGLVALPAAVERICRILDDLSSDAEALEALAGSAIALAASAPGSKIVDLANFRGAQITVPQ